MQIKLVSVLHSYQTIYQNKLTCFDGYHKNSTWGHFFFLSNGVVAGELHPLMSFNAGDAEKLHTFHTIASGLCVVFTAHTQLQR